MVSDAAVSLVGLHPGLVPADTAIVVPADTAIGIPASAAESPSAATLRPAPPAFTRLSTGNARLDVLLGGGYPAGAASLLYGPPFVGKQVLQQLAFTSAACRGMPSTFILHGVTADAMSRRLCFLEPAFAQAEKAGNVSYVDAHSHFLGEPTAHPNAVYVADPNDTVGLVKALDDRPGFPSGPGLVAVQSASTALVDLGPSRAFQFLRSILGRTLRAGGVGLVSLQSGMHTDSEVQMAKSVCAGMLELRKKGDALYLHIEGLETSVAKPGWIEYELNSRGFRVTGSFATKTIR